MNTELIKKYQEQLEKAIGHLQYSRKKVQLLPTKLTENDEETLETWESFTARFARVVDIFLTKFIKAKIKLEDPAFDGSLRDYLNLAAKLGWVSDVDRWVSMRELRNIQAHDYTDETFLKFVDAVRLESDFIIPRILKILQK